MTAKEYAKILFQTITPSMSYDGQNFLPWQAQAREKLRDLLGFSYFEQTSPNVEIEYEQQIEDATEIRFTFESEPGYRVPCHLLLPDGIANPPVMICLQGHTKGMHISLGRPKYPGDAEKIAAGDRDFCVRALKEGYAAIAMEQRNLGECGGPVDGTQCQEATMKNILMGRCTVGERTWDLLRLLDVLETTFSDRVNLEKLCCMGHSAGGTTIAYAAALDDRIKLAMSSCAVCTFRDSIVYTEHCECNYVPKMGRFFDMGDLVAMACPKYYVQVNGVDDPVFLIDGAKSAHAQGKAAYEQQGVADRCAFVEGFDGHRFYADASWPVVHRMMGTGRN